MTKNLDWKIYIYIYIYSHRVSEKNGRIAMFSYMPTKNRKTHLFHVVLLNTCNKVELNLFGFVFVEVLLEFMVLLDGTIDCCVCVGHQILAFSTGNKKRG
jgi:hypothetical protein